MDELLPFDDPKYIAEPHAHWQRLRDEAPVYWSDAHRFWAITRYDDVIAVLRLGGSGSIFDGPISTDPSNPRGR